MSQTKLSHTAALYRGPQMEAPHKTASATPRDSGSRLQGAHWCQTHTEKNKPGPSYLLKFTFHVHLDKEHRPTLSYRK